MCQQCTVEHGYACVLGAKLSEKKLRLFLFWTALQANTGDYKI